MEMTKKQRTAAALTAAAVIIGGTAVYSVKDRRPKPPKSTTTTSAVASTSTAPDLTTSTTITVTSTSGPIVHAGVPVNEATIPSPVPGFSENRIATANFGPDLSDGVGAFRTNCATSHYNWDDPIVFPGWSNATHLHTFFGNTRTGAPSTPSSILDSGNSTCSGGTLNRSAYWAPTMIDTATGSVVPGEGGGDALQVYYKTGYRGVPSNTVRNFPAGLRMIAGDSRRTTAPDPFNPAAARYECHGGDGQHFNSIPSCAPGLLMIMSVQFPQCWDGVNLDSPDHQSHMAYGTPYGLQNPGCPSTHPVPLPEITMNLRYPVGPSGSASWRLSSDVYSGPAGYSGHADWMNGWDAPTFQRIVNNCYQPGLDCHMNLLGDGQALN